MNSNYQKELDKIIENLTENQAKNGLTPTLLLHSCCAPCSSYVLEYLSNYFKITVFYYNPNIHPEPEYNRRVEEQQRLITEFNKKQETKNIIQYMVGTYNTTLFYDLAKGYEKDVEGGERCFRCYGFRLREAAKLASEHKFDYFTTTLSISPYKNAAKLNEIGEVLENEYGIKYLPSDFKKKNGYKRSIELSKEYNLYRQDYCGCIYSKLVRDNYLAENNILKEN